MVGWEVFLLEICGTLFLLRIISAILRGLDTNYVYHTGQGWIILIKNWVYKSCCGANIGVLPPECVDHIFSYLDLRDLLHCAEVSTRWRDIVKTHHIWNHADFRKITISANEKRVDKVPYERYIKFLKATDVKVRKVTFDADVADPDFLSKNSFDNLMAFLSAGNCKNVKHFSLKWAGNWEEIESENFEVAHVLSLSTLVLLTSYCPKLYQLDTQFNWTADSLEYLVPLKNLQILEITCVPPVHGIQKWHLNKLLEELVCLQVFKLQATLLPHHALMQKYTFKSESLKTLDILECINFSIVQLILPKLECFKGKDVNTYLHQICIFDLLADGCPSLKQLNALSSVKPGLENFPLNKDVKTQMRLCSCEEHNTRR